jgi:hypothetical protein
MANRKGLLICLLCIGLNPAIAQNYKFYYSNTVKFLKSNGTDSLSMPFTGGLNAAQISNIDLNGDGKQDLYVFDRAGNKSLTFLRKGNGFEYTPYYDGRFPQMTDWALLSDFDADGKPDIYTEISRERGALVDTVQEVTISGLRILRNISDTKIKFKQLSNQVQDTGGNISGFPVEKSNIYINYTDIAGIGDIDSDGDADILPFVQASLSPYYYENYFKNKNNFTYSHDSTRFIWRDQCWGYMMYDRTYLTNTFELGLKKSDMSSCFYQMYDKHSMHTNNSLCILDYNGDGTQDIIYGDGGYTNLLLLVNGRHLNSLGRDSIISQDTSFPSNTTRANFIIFPVAYYVDVDGDGVKELLVTTNEPLAAKSTNNIWLYENTGTTAKPVFNYSGNNFFMFDETIDLGTRSSPTLVDIDQDGDEDLIVGTYGDFDQTKYFNDRLVWYKNIGKVAGRSVFQMADTNFLMLSKDTPVLGMSPTFADLNGDGKKDLIIGEMNGYLYHYINNSVGTNFNFTLQTRNFGGIDAGTNASPAFYDMDKDGDLDLVVGNRNGFLKYYMNSGTSTSPQFSATPTIDSLGKVLVNHTYTNIYGTKTTDVLGYATPVIYDLNNDNNPEIIVGSLYGNVYVYTDVNLIPGSVFTRLENIFVDYSDSTIAKPITFGNQSRPCIGLLDEDTKPDMLIGNIRGGLTFYGSKTEGGVGIDDEFSTAKIFSAYPNPTADLVTLQYNNLNTSGTYTVINQLGQALLAGIVNHYVSECPIDLSNLDAGIYFIRVESGNYNQTLKIVKR